MIHKSKSSCLFIWSFFCLFLSFVLQISFNSTLLLVISFTKAKIILLSFLIAKLVSKSKLHKFVFSISNKKAFDEKSPFKCIQSRYENIFLFYISTLHCKIPSIKVDAVDSSGFHIHEVKKCCNFSSTASVFVHRSEIFTKFSIVSSIDSDVFN